MGPQTPQAEAVADDEPLTRGTEDRFVLFPIKHPDVFEFYKKAVASFWTVDEVDLADDKKHWDALTDDERFFISHVLAFFAASDGAIVENIAARFLGEVQMPEARNFYAFQISNEAVHSEMYSLLIDTYIKDGEERERLFRAVENFPAIRAKAQWALRWISSDRTFAERLVAFAAVEGILFSGSFAAIYYMKKRGLLPGLCFSNTMIARDEGLHRDFACNLFVRHIKNKPSQETVHAIIREAVEVEVQFVCEALPVNLIGMSAETMSTYIQFVSDHLLVSLGFEKIYNVENPYDWMDLIALVQKGNFFECRVGEYQKAGVMASLANPSTSHGFSVDEDF